MSASSLTRRLRICVEKLGSLRTRDIAATLSPAVAFGACVGALGQAVFALSFGSVAVVLAGAVVAQTVIPLLLLWFACRRLLLVSRWKSVEILILGEILEYACGTVVFSLLSRGLVLFTAS